MSVEQNEVVPGDFDGDEFDPKDDAEGKEPGRLSTALQNAAHNNLGAGALAMGGKRMAQLGIPVAMEVTVDDNIERAMKVLKRKLIKEGLFKELKARKYFEKPSERRKRKQKESVKKIRKDAARAKKNSQLF